MRRRNYIEFLLPGSFWPEEEIVEVTPDTLASLRIPQNAFALCHFHIIETTLPDGTILESERLDVSGRYYIGGRVMSLADVKREMPDARILIRNMEGNGWDRVI